jgi:protein TonB
MPLAIAAAVLVAGIGFGAFYMIRKAPQSPVAAQKPATASMVPTPKAQLISQPLVATPVSTSSAPINPADAEAARKKAFEEAVQKKLQDEMMKLQRDYTNSLQQQQAKHAPVPVAVVPAPAPVRDEPSAAQLDQQRLNTRTETAAAAVTPAVTQSAAPAVTHPDQPAAPQPAVAAVHEGDVIAVESLDTAPSISRRVAPTYPIMALKQRVESTIFVTALVSESGDVIEVRILRGDKRFGFEEAALKAVRATKFTPPVKDGKRVKTWFPLPVQFKL